MEHSSVESMLMLDCLVGCNLKTLGGAFTSQQEGHIGLYPGLDTPCLCGVCVFSPCLCGFPPTIKNTYTRSVFWSWPRYWLRTGVGPWALQSGCPVLLIIWVKGRDCIWLNLCTLYRCTCHHSGLVSAYYMTTQDKFSYQEETSGRVRFWVVSYGAVSVVEQPTTCCSAARVASQKTLWTYIIIPFLWPQVEPSNKLRCHPSSYWKQVDKKCSHCWRGSS